MSVSGDGPVTVSHYRIVQKLRSGGMAEVYLAEDTVLPRVVALKLLPADRAGDDALKHRFMREARAASSLTHPNIAVIHEAGEDNGRAFIIMEYVEGESLEERIERGALPIDEIASIGGELAAAVAEAHKCGVIHRDLKPSNVMLTVHGHVKVLDFGLAKFDEPRTTPQDITAWKTESGVVMGTPPYMSPEQALGKPVDQRSDIWSIGAVLYVLVTSRLPFPGTTVAETLFRIVNSEPEPMARFNYELPAELERIIRKCLDKSPDRRYQTAADLLVDLRNFDRDRQSGISKQTPLRARAPHYRAQLIWSAILLVALIGVVWKQHGRKPKMPQNREAYGLYIKAQQQWSTRTKEGLHEALDLYRQTIEAEPAFAPAYAGLADTYSLLERYAAEPNAESRSRAIAAADHAISLDPELAEAHAARASVRETYLWDWAGAEDEYRKAIDLDPRDATAHHWYALLLARLGRFAEARQEISIARDLEPKSPAIAAAVANIDYYAADFDRSVQEAREALKVQNDFVAARLQLVLSLMMSGDLETAAVELEALAGKAPEAAFLQAMIRARSGDTQFGRAFVAAVESRSDAKANAYAIAAVNMSCGEPREALKWLQTAVEMHSFWTGYLGVDPIFNPLHRDPEFQQLLTRVGLSAHAS